jgi:OFA family oxalate/formate antiporter-like MFS transporter
VSRNLSHLPFKPAKWPFFYGWAIVLWATLGVLMSMPGQTMGVSAFTDHLIKALGITRGQLSLAYMFGTIGSALVLTPAGKLFDRVGARVMATGATLMLGVVLAILSQCDRISAGLASLFDCEPSIWTAFPVMLIGFFLLRLSGQGLLTLSSRNMLMKWFDRRRGLVNGLSGVFVSFGFSGTPLFLAWLILQGGWRNAWLILAVAAGVVFPVLTLLFFRDNPEDCGLKPDGDLAENPHSKAMEHPIFKQFNLSETRRTMAFWVFAIPLAMNGLYFTGLAFHIESIFKHAGMESTEAFSIFLPVSVLSVSINLVGGWVSDRIHLKYLLMIMLLGSLVAYLGFFLLAPGWTKWLMIVGSGLCAGCWNVLMAVTWPRFFGREHLGAISGFFMALIVFASAIGPWMMSLSLDVTGAYGPAVILCAGISVLIFFFAIRVQNPQETLGAEA